MNRSSFAPHGAARWYASRGTLAFSATALTLALALTAGPFPLAGRASAAAGCSGVESDFNGDGIRDTAIADPEATAAGIAKAGVVHIVYGGGKGNLELTQEAAKAGPSEAGDQFGFSMAVYDADLDGCSDLAIGTPYEDVEANVDAGRAVVVYGSPTGLAAGRTSTEYIQGAGPVPGAAEAYDWVGYSVAAGKSAEGVPFLVIGLPGEDIFTQVDAGGFLYIAGASTVTVGVVTQDVATAGAVPDTLEAYDRFGSAIVATPTHFAVSSPGEAQAAILEAGAVTIFSHALTSGVPKPLNVITQDTPNVTGACELGDSFGTALAAVPYRAAGATSTTESLLAVGVPGEDLSTTLDAGAVQVFKLDAAGAYTELNWIDQNTANVEHGSEAGDYFGQRLAAANTAPTATTTATNTRIAIGVPGKDGPNGLVDRGQVAILPMVGPPGDGDALLEPGYGLTTPAGPRLYSGMSLGAGPTGLFVGQPYGPTDGRAVYVYPWTTGGGAAPTATFKPGQGGIPAAANTFGTVVR